MVTAHSQWGCCVPQRAHGPGLWGSFVLPCVVRRAELTNVRRYLQVWRKVWCGWHEATDLGWPFHERLTPTVTLETLVFEKVLSRWLSISRSPPSTLQDQTIEPVLPSRSLRAYGTPSCRSAKRRPDTITGSDATVICGQWARAGRQGLNLWPDFAPVCPLEFATVMPLTDLCSD